MLIENVEKVACVRCIDKHGYSTKHYIFLNMSLLKDGWAKEFMSRVNEEYDSYTVVRKVLYV